MAILRHSRIALTMEVYTQVPDKTTRDALKRLSDLLGGPQGDAEATSADPPTDGGPVASAPSVATLRYAVAARASKQRPVSMFATGL